MLAPVGIIGRIIPVSWPWIAGFRERFTHIVWKQIVMAVLLLNLRDVPDDEIAEIREMLDQHQIAFYETEPNRWGISAGAIWIKEESESDRAKVLMAGYQAERKTRAQSDYETAKREGTLETFWSQMRKQPLRLVMILFGAAILVALSLWPFLLAA